MKLHEGNKISTKFRGRIIYSDLVQMLGIHSPNYKWREGTSIVSDRIPDKWKGEEVEVEIKIKLADETNKTRKTN